MSKIEAFWQPATADDVAEIMKTGNPILARVRDEGSEVWQEDLLSGWKVSRLAPGPRWVDADGVLWKQCQVYREPSWYAEKPDPGPGFRLLGKFPDEPKLATDEGWFPGDATWCPVEDNGIQLEGYWYRRRIEAVEPEPKHYVLRVGDSVETPSGHRIEIVSRGETQRTYALTAGGKVTLPNGQTITITEKGFEVTQ
jgi:hypothetical protein